MTRVHPQFLMNGFKKAVEKQDFGEFNKELTNGMNLLKEFEDGKHTIKSLRDKLVNETGIALTEVQE